MLVTATKLTGTPILSMQAGGAIGYIKEPIIDPDGLKVVAFYLEGGVIPRSGANILDISSIREYSKYGMVIDSIEELIAPGDVVKVDKILELNFNLIDLKVETKKRSKLGKVMDYTIDPESYIVQQIIVKRPVMKSFLDPELTIHRKEIVEITDYKIIIKDEEKELKERAEKEDFVPNFVNPFREPGFAPAEMKNPDDKDTE